MARRPSAYDGKEADNTMDKLSAKLSADLRGSIRALASARTVIHEHRVGEASEACLITEF